VNLGAHCVKAASVREHGHGGRRLKYPMKLGDAKWKRITWDQAVNEIGDQLIKLREEHGLDALFFCGSSKPATKAFIYGANSWHSGVRTTGITRPVGRRAHHTLVYSRAVYRYGDHGLKPDLRPPRADPIDGCGRIRMVGAGPA
jgi:anaerobic selenocysteine-containing dehydrogenase